MPPRLPLRECCRSCCCSGGQAVSVLLSEARLTEFVVVAVVLGLGGDGGALDFDLLISVVIVNLGRLVHPALLRFITSIQTAFKCDKQGIAQSEDKAQAEGLWVAHA